MISILLDKSEPLCHEKDSIIDWKRMPTQSLDLYLCHDEIRGQGIVILQVVFRFLECFLGDPIDVILVIFLENLLQKFPDRSGT